MYDTRNAQKPGLKNTSAFGTDTLTLKDLLSPFALKLKDLLSSFRDVKIKPVYNVLYQMLYTGPESQNVSQEKKLYTEL